jgi:hypothetical protein
MDITLPGEPMSRLKDVSCLDFSWLLSLHSDPYMGIVQWLGLTGRERGTFGIFGMWVGGVTVCTQQQY